MFSIQSMKNIPSQFPFWCLIVENLLSSVAVISFLAEKQTEDAIQGGKDILYGLVEIIYWVIYRNTQGKYDSTELPSTALVLLLFCLGAGSAIQGLEPWLNMLKNCLTMKGSIGAFMKKHGPMFCLLEPLFVCLIHAPYITLFSTLSFVRILSLLPLGKILWSKLR